MNGHPPSENDPQEQIRALMEESLETLRIYRHDLMNQVQLLQAYTQMKKYDRLNEPIQTLVQEAHHHSEWSSLPSLMMSYVVLSRGITYSMLNLDVAYEEVESPVLEAEMRAARLLSDILDCLGSESKTLLEPVPVDVWIVSFSQGYEIGWFLSEQAGQESLAIDWQAWAQKWTQQQVECSQEQVEDGIEYKVRFTV